MARTLGVRALVAVAVVMAGVGQAPPKGTRVAGVASDFRYVDGEKPGTKGIRFRVDTDSGATADYRAYADARINIPGRKRAPLHEVYIWGLTADSPRVSLRETDRRVYEATFKGQEP